ncbi:hypothetical protein J6590_073729 [Homalodisca vitripennis]|nr:hypothetical protein J6590_073729 [Homalodisca vitripennis]
MAESRLNITDNSSLDTRLEELAENINAMFLLFNAMIVSREYERGRWSDFETSVSFVDTKLQSALPRLTILCMSQQIEIGCS